MANKPLTKELTAEELNVILPALVKYLKRNTNDSNFRTAERIIDWFSYKKEAIGFNTIFDKQRLMKLINHIRMTGILPLCSGRYGYWVTSDPQKIQDTIDEFHGRVESHLAMIGALKQIKSDLLMEKQKIIDDFNKAKVKIDNKKPKVKKMDDIFDNVDNWNKPEDLFK